MKYYTRLTMLDEMSTKNECDVNEH